MKAKLLKRLRSKVECKILPKDSMNDTYCVINIEYKGYYFSKKNVLTSQARNKANELIREAAILLHGEELNHVRTIYLFKS